MGGVGAIKWRATAMKAKTKLAATLRLIWENGRRGAEA